MHDTMTEHGYERDHLCNFPTEVLLLIFTFLPGKQLARCRQVCWRWKQIIDGLTRSDALWREHCRTDFANVYKVARMKAKVGMLWFNIYRCLSLWPRLCQAREVRDEFASASNVNDEIKNFEILRDGIIGVHKRGAIVYYDIQTLEPARRGNITGDYMRYTENEDFIVILSYHLHLFIIRKVLQNPHHETNVTFDHVKSYILIENDIYFVNLNNAIHVCHLDDSELRGVHLKTSEESVMALGFTNYLNILTFERNIYSLINNELVLTCCLDDHSNMLHQLYLYNLLERVDWRIFNEWMCILRRKVPEGPLQDIISLRVYGDIVFIGCNWGVLRIYHAPFQNGQFDFYSAEPVKQYNFMERSDCPVLTRCPILQVDAIEAEDGHAIIVAMPKKIAVLDFIHSFKRTASVAMLPYIDVQKVKVLKIK